MGRFLRRVRLWFRRGRSIESKVDALRRTENARHIETINEISALGMRLENIEQKIDKIIESLTQRNDADGANGVDAKQLLNEYLYGEHGDE